MRLACVRLVLGSTIVFGIALTQCGASPAPPTSAAVAGAGAHAAAPEPAMTSADIDVALREAWRRGGVTPAATIDDARFLRRAYLDIVGVIPPPERVTAFLEDRRADKRSRAVAELLASPAYADHWARIWDDTLLGRTRPAELDRRAFHDWLHDAFARNLPWDQLAFTVLTASGDSTQVGAANYAVKYRDTPQDFAGASSKTFLGTQIQCAQCHDHKTEKWTQRDFQSFAACFARTQARNIGDKVMKGPREFEVRDLDRPLPRFAKNTDTKELVSATPKALDGTPITGNTRESVARWMVASPAFDHAIVNRMWGHFLGRGFANPVDDLRPSNPTELPELFDRIAQDFRTHGHDLKHLIALIVGTEAYALSPDPPPLDASRGASGAPLDPKPDAASGVKSNALSSADIKLWSRFRLVPLDAETLVSSLVAATDIDAVIAQRPEEREALRDKLIDMFSFVFDVDEEFDQVRYEGTLSQALVLLNGKLTSFGTSTRPGTAARTIATSDMTDEARIEALYLRTLSRRPTQAELDSTMAYLTYAPTLDAAPTWGQRIGGHVTGGGDATAVLRRNFKPGKGGKGDPLGRLGAVPRAADAKAAALEDVQWALVNSSEFALNH